MSYKYMGPRGPETGVADPTGNNTGNWTIIFNPVLLNFTIPQVYIYKITVNGALGSSFDLYIENQRHASNIFGNQNDFNDTSDSIIIRPGETLYFYFNNPSTDGSPPIATVFLRYDYSLYGESTIYRG